MGSPGSELRRPVWPASPGGIRRSARLYPTIPPEDSVVPSPFRSNFAPANIPSVEISKATPIKSSLPQTMPSNGPEDVFSPSKLSSTSAARAAERKEARLSMPQNEPFLFGSPLPQPALSNKQFDQTAASVLEEMNKRLADAGVPKVEKTVLDPLDAIRAASAAVKGQKRDSGGGNGVDRFAKVHEEAFEKMDSIATHYAARRPAVDDAQLGAKRKSDVFSVGHGRPSVQGGRKASVAVTRVVSTEVRKKMAIPGGFGDEDPEDQEVEAVADRRSSKRIRITEGADVHKGRTPSLAFSQKSREQQERERDAVRRHLDAARRRSSRGRTNTGGKAASAGECSWRRQPESVCANIIISLKANQRVAGFSPLPRASRVTCGTWVHLAGELPKFPP